MKRVFSKDASLAERATALGVAAAMKIKRHLTGKGLFKKHLKKTGKGLTKKRLKKTGKGLIKKRLKKTSKGLTKKCLKRTGKGLNKKTGKGLSKKHLKKTGNGISKKRSKQMKKMKHVTLSNLIKSAKAAIKKNRPDTVASAINVAVKSIKKSKRGKSVKTPCSIKLPTYTGGVLPLIPIFAGLSALGSIAGGAASITNAINVARKGQFEMDENKRHNRAMETITIGNKSGKGFYLRSNKNGSGFYLKPFAKNR